MCVTAHLSGTAVHGCAKDLVKWSRLTGQQEARRRSLSRSVDTLSNGRHLPCHWGTGGVTTSLSAFVYEHMWESQEGQSCITHQEALSLHQLGAHNQPSACHTNT